MNCLDLRGLINPFNLLKASNALKQLKGIPSKAFRVSDDLWTRMVFEAAVAYHRGHIIRDHLLKSLTPLYLGRTASFVLDTQALTTEEAEDRVESLCEAFEREKTYLVKKWNE